MKETKLKLEQINKESDSLEQLNKVNSKIKHFHTDTHILYDIRTFLGQLPKHYVEIGSYTGSSACLMLQHRFNTHVTCIDPLNLPASHFNGNKKETCRFLNINYRTLQRKLQD